MFRKGRTPTIGIAALGLVLSALPVAPAQARTQHGSATPRGAAVVYDAPLTSAGDRPAGQRPGTVVVAPASLDLALGSGQQTQRTLALANRGTTEVTWQAADGSGRAGEPPAPAGTVLRSWLPGGVNIAWGIGLESDIVWLSDVDFLRIESFTMDGVKREEGFPTGWVHENLGPADMAYVPNRGLMCEATVGADNGIHCWQPRTGDTLADIAGDFPWTTTYQYGLAYRPDDDTFYVGGWHQGIIYHIAGLGHANPGSVIGQCVPADPMISGLAWSAGFGMLWVVTDSAEPLIYAVDPETCATIATIIPPDRDAFNGGGLDVDRNGNLWVVSRLTGPWYMGTVYQIASGVPVFTDAPWVSVAQSSGALAPGAVRRLTVRVDTRGLARGCHRATLYLRSDDAQRPLITVPIRLTVR